MMLACAAATDAQVLNGSFELTRADNTIANWAVKGQVVVPLDTTEPCPLDSLYFLVNDPHEGKFALEVRNIACEAGVSSVKMSVSDDMPAFGPSQPFRLSPEAFSFYYKFFPRNGEGIRMYITLLDDQLNTVATADSVLFPGTAVAYTEAILPLQYAGTAQPERMMLQFFITDAGGGTAGLEGGARLVIDDISPVNKVTGFPEHASATATALSCFPTMATGQIYLHLPHYKGYSRVQILDAAGRTVREIPEILLTQARSVDVAGLAPGLYVVHVVNGAGACKARFIHH